MLPACAGRREPAQTAPVTTVTPADAPARPGRGYYMGLLPTPAQGQDLGEAYRQAARHAEFAPVWGRPTPYYGLREEFSGGWFDMFVKGALRGNGLFPLVHMSFIGPQYTLIAPPTMGQAATLADPAWRASYKQAALDVVRMARPLYLSLGNEVNLWYERYGDREGDPDGFRHYVTLYEETYSAVKAIAPQTKVFCVFAREVVAEFREADLRVLRMFDPGKLDLLAFTSYPFALRGVNSPVDLPDDYYTRALALAPGRPLAFTELGWPSLAALGGEAGQAEFLSAVAGRLTAAARKDGGTQSHVLPPPPSQQQQQQQPGGAGVGPSPGPGLELLGWAWLHDLAPDDQTGLIRLDGTPKRAYAVWQALSGR